MTATALPSLDSVTELATEHLAEQILRSIISCDPDSFDRATMLARGLLSLRMEAIALEQRLSSRTETVGMESPCAGAVTQLGKAVPASSSTTSGPDSTEHLKSYTPAEQYAPYVLLAFALLGGSAVFRDCQEVMVAAMRLDEVLHPLDEVTTDGTTRARYLANSTSHRATMIRRGLLVKMADGTDSPTDAGLKSLDSWFAERKFSIDRYADAVSEVLVDKYFLLGSYAMTLKLMGGEANDREILQTMNRLLNRPVAAPSKSPSQDRSISRSHVTTFSRLGVIKCLANGLIRLTTKGEFAAEDWVRRTSLDQQILSNRLPKKYRQESTRLSSAKPVSQLV